MARPKKLNKVRTYPIGFRVPEDLKNDLQLAAELEERELSDFVRVALRRYLRLNVKEKVEV